ncbi:MAG: hypothetical protein L6R39_004632 [Caloplaca ligustica]|nr:MAG: hypothetical protein L6R39_004632 [Caloplaca ligustica]
MSIFPEPPFDEREEKAFDNLYARVFQFPLQPLGPALPAPHPSPTTKARKRPVAGAEIPPGLNRELQPRTSGFVTVNEPLESTAYPPGLLENPDQRKKKRGRPSKAEIEVKAAEYAARGEPYPPPRRSKNPKISAEGVATTGPPITFTPVTMGPSGAEGISSAKKRTPKAKAQKDTPVTGYGPAASPIHHFHGDPGILNPTRGTTFPSPQPGPRETTFAGMGPAAQDQPTEGRDITEPHQHQGESQMVPSEGSPRREGASSEYTHEAGYDTLQTSSTAQQPAIVEHGSPSVMHSPGQRE